MEPRPPRPRNPQPAFPGSAAQAARAGAAPAGPAGYDVYPYGPAGAVPPAPPLGGELLPRQERRRQQAWRGVAVFVLALALIGGLGYVFRETLLPRNPAPTATAPAGPALASSPAAPVATPTAAPAIANLLATTTPTPEPARPTPAPTATPVPAASGGASDAAPVSDSALVPLVDLLPTVNEVPAGLTVAATDERSEPQVVASLGDTAEDAQLLDDWGWEGNAFRDFTGSTESGTYALNVSIHRFADDASADDALIYFSDKIVGGPEGYADAEVEPLGDAVRLLVGTPAGDPTSVIYMRDGMVLYRIGGTAAADSGGDPTADVIAVAQALLAR